MSDSGEYVRMSDNAQQWQPPRGEDDLLIKANNSGFAVTERPVHEEEPIVAPPPGP
jgi:hypothetical protein